MAILLQRQLSHQVLRSVPVTPEQSFSSSFVSLTPENIGSFFPSVSSGSNTDDNVVSIPSADSHVQTSSQHSVLPSEVIAFVF